MRLYLHNVLICVILCIVNDNLLKGNDMTVKQLIKQLEQLDPKAECIFAEYTEPHGKTETLLWYLGICCNWEHQQKVKQVWFNRNLLVQD